jgi:tRNA 2-thiocytidine biosynthesis protein TtcA
VTSRLEHKLVGLVGRASRDYGLLEAGDRVMVAVSGGKDSHAMLYLLRALQKRAPFEFSIVAVNLDQGHPGYPGEILRDYLEREGYEHRMLRQDTYSVVVEKVPVGKTYCSLCSRLRRGILYKAAQELGCTKIALGHHRDDTIVTLMLNLLYAGQIKAMPPRLTSDDGRNVVIRPLILCEEAELAAFAREMAFPILPCDLCGSQENLQRKQVSRMLDELQAKNANIKGNLFAALSNVKPSHLLDTALRGAMGIDDERQDPVEVDPDSWTTFGETGAGTDV